MRWFSGRKAEKIRKQKIKVRKAPKAVNGPKPVYKSPEHRQRAPKIRKPFVKRPFITDFASQRQAADHPQDTSVAALEVCKTSANGPVVDIEWHGQGRCQDCSLMSGSHWESVDRFLEDRPMAFAPRTGKSVGLYGYSHPGCTCYLRVTYENGQTEDLGPYA